MNKILFNIIFVTSIIILSSAANAVEYQLIGLGGGTAVTAINDSGTVVGTKANQAFSWSTTTGIQYIGSFAGGSSVSSAQGINNLGQIVGYSNTANGDHAFLWSPTTGMQDLGELAGGLNYRV